MTSPASPAAPPENAGRDPKGRFATGNPGGPGNPFARRVAALRSALIQSVQAEDLIAIARTLIEKARTGDTAAAKLVYQYVLGKPAAPVDPDRLDADEWQGYKETAGMMKELPQVGTVPAAELPLHQVRSSRPILAEAYGQQMADGFRQMADEARRKCQTVPNEDSPPSPDGENGAFEEPDPPLDEGAWQALFGDTIPFPGRGEPPPSPPAGAARAAAVRP